MYWYFAQGAMRFLMKDIKWLWPRFFNPKDDKNTPLSFQELGIDTQHALNDAMNKYALGDKQFDQFTEQLSKFDVKDV